MAKKNKEPDVRQPSPEEQRWYQSALRNDASVVKVRDKRYKIRWLCAHQLVKLGRLLLRKRDVDVVLENGGTDTILSRDVLSAFSSDQKLICKTAAIFLLDGFWSIRLRYWFLWRWFYYIRQYDAFDLEQLIAEGKKKVPLEQFLKVTMYLTGAKDTLMMMRTEEAERILRELSGAVSTPSVSPSAVSATLDTSSSA